MTSHKIQEENVRAGMSIMQNIAALGATTMGQQFKGVVGSPEFTEAIKRSGSALMADPQFQKSIKSIFSSIASDLLSTEEIRNIFIDVLRMGIENLVSSPVVRELLVNITTSMVTNVSETFSQQSREVKSFMGEEISSGIQAGFKELMIPLEEVMQNSIKEAVSNIKPEITFNATAKMDLSKE